MDDLAGLGKVAQALLQAIQSAVGTMYRPRAIRNERKAAADAEAYKIITTARALASARIVEADMGELVERAAMRFVQEEINKQANIEAIVDRTIACLESDKIRAESIITPDPNFLLDFFEKCSHASNDKIREIWARILAGKVSDTIDASAKLIDCLRFVNVDLAEQFAAIVPQVYLFQGFFLSMANVISPTTISVDWQADGRLLAEIGLLERVRPICFKFGHLTVQISPPNDRLEPNWATDFYEFTPSGAQLALAVCERMARHRDQLFEDKTFEVDGVEYVDRRYKQGLWIPRHNLGYKFQPIVYTDELAEIDATIMSEDEQIDIVCGHMFMALNEQSSLEISVRSSGDGRMRHRILTIDYTKDNLAIVQHIDIGKHRLQKKERRFLRRLLSYSKGLKAKPKPAHRRNKGEPSVRRGRKP